jgi:hypothetical protein
MPRVFRVKDAHVLFAVAACRGVLPITTGAVETGGSNLSCLIINVGVGGVRAVTISWSLGPNVNDLLLKIDNTNRPKCPSPFFSYSLKAP